MARLTVNNAMAALEQSDAPFVELFRHGSLRVEFYQPKGVDRQSPHEQDEIYVIASGSGSFLSGEQVQPFSAGEVLFVPAGQVHRFESFSDDFATWVFFYGPKGGEANNFEGENT